ncbi:protein-L-isoaspartate O-methyltransferase [Ramaria rubella]|nr:protein-L-isoaspartate O-methyltransferase [Ramaria rubella]
MAWRCSGKSNDELIDNMKKNKLLISARVTAAMKQVDRANYVLDEEDAYHDSPQTISYGATISAPHMHAHAAENLLPFLEPGYKVLDVGSGSGYTCAIFHHLVSPPSAEKKGRVVGIDHIPELVEWSVANLKRDNLSLALGKEIEVVVGDGRQGYSLEGNTFGMCVRSQAKGEL